MSRQPLFTGCATAMITPFDEDGHLDLPALDRLIDIQLENGIDALVACGTTGEPAVMTDDEWSEIVRRTVRRVNGRIPVIAGTGSNNTAQVIRKASIARELGADAQLVVTPFYNKTTQAGLIAHYRAIASAGDLPIIIYNVPSRTGLNILPATLYELMGEEKVIGLKEAAGDAARAADISALCGDGLPLYSGSDELTVQLRSVGSLGTVSVLSNLLPDEMVRMTHLDLKEAAKVQLRLMPLIRLLFREVSPIPIKAAMSMAGLCKNVLRLPLVPLSDENAVLLEKELRRLGIL